jgi:arginyl-tRNA synthetase
MSYEPHRLTYYLQQLAGLLHGFYNKHRILPPAAEKEDVEEEASAMAPEEAAPREHVDSERTAARLALMAGVQQVLRNGLSLLGISAPDHM